jgi:lysophospholipase L1-like esterase
LALGLASFVFAIVVLEGALRLAGWVMIRFAFGQGSHGSPEQAILCIGDSFTMGGLSTFDDSYPIQLQRLFSERLAEAGVQVVNLGRAGSNTSQMLRNLNRGITEHHPDVVLVLGGWNNFRNFYGYRQPGESADERRGLADLMLDLRVYKLGLMATERVRGIGPKPLETQNFERRSAIEHLDATRRLTSDSSGHLERGMAHKEAGEFDRAIECFVESVVANPTDPRGYRQIAKTIRDPELARRFFVERAEEHADQAWPLIGLSLLHLDQGRFDDARASLERVRTSDPALSEYIDDSLHLLDRDRSRSEIEAWIHLDLTDMKRLCERHDALLVIQNYPLGDFSMLAEFATRENLPLVDHHAVFEAVPKTERDALFLPGDFHPNAEGNAIMASTLYTTLMSTGRIRKAATHGP